MVNLSSAIDDLWLRVAAGRLARVRTSQGYSDCQRYITKAARVAMSVRARDHVGDLCSVR